MTLASANIAEHKAATLVVISEELARSSGAEDFVARELRLGLSAAVNAEFLPGLIHSSTPVVTGSGAGPAVVAADVAAAKLDDDTITLDASRNASIEMADDPAHNSTTPTGPARCRPFLFARRSDHRGSRG